MRTARVTKVTDSETDWPGAENPTTNARQCSRVELLFAIEDVLTVVDSEAMVRGIPEEDRNDLLVHVYDSSDVIWVCFAGRGQVHAVMIESQDGGRGFNATVTPSELAKLHAYLADIENVDRVEVASVEEGLGVAPSKPPLAADKHTVPASSGVSAAGVVTLVNHVTAGEPTEVFIQADSLIDALSSPSIDEVRIYATTRGVAYRMLKIVGPENSVFTIGAVYAE